MRRPDERDGRGIRPELTADAGGRVGDHRLDPLTAAAADHGVTFFAGAAVRRADAARTNSVLAFDADADGAATVVYDKQHLWHAGERSLFTPGRCGTVLPVGGWELGLGICYDMSFPEHGRAAALAGAHAYVCPCAFAAGNEHRAAVYLAARALENTVYAFFVNAAGGPRHRPCGAGTAVYGPDGTRVARAATAREEIVLADLDPGELGRVREFLHMLDECRTSLARPAVPDGDAVRTPDETALRRMPRDDPTTAAQLPVADRRGAAGA
ncbi:carbon-nitrogen hydrolase family protein [Actinomadura hallensis]|uniref:carbon-nitrogen hydrolase family protein n=1 Tax=Actinomadura hallensis TaxID=337895 RepID=UPI002482B6A5|nr:carbon-nitrogen hydrolase family protein [Actinomadura hallensis]